MKRLTIFFLFLFSANLVVAQYFGKNKVKYEDFDFKIYNTPHFEIYHYLKDQESLNRLAQLSERWYLRHQVVFQDTFNTPNPIILYNDHAEFQQNTVIESLLGVGTGGVTEGIKNRVVFPITTTHKATNHVLGHELVHAFQYNLVKTSDSTSLQNIGNLPLWMVEGLAEYLSIGEVDAQTAMWLRDAIATDDLPNFKDLSMRPGEYFPYRYGHAFWAFIGGTFGDNYILPLFMGTAKYGYAQAMDSVLGYDAEALGKMWINSIRRSYAPYVDETYEFVGEPLFTHENFGERNLSPVLSPDGTKMVFISDRNVINIGIFLANTETRKIEKKLTRIVQQGHVDDYNFIESQGSWSPDGSRYIFSTFVRGNNRLVMVNARNGRKIKEIKIPQLEAFQNPAWSPDGQNILLEGLKEGVSDLYLYNLESKEIINLTNDAYSDVQPTWSPDGQQILFVSDRGPYTDLTIHKYGNFRLSLYDLGNGQVSTLNIFPEANNVSPQYSTNGNIYFLSDRDGFRNLYEYNPVNQDLFQLTTYITGISGITELSPAISVNSNQIAYSVYQDDGYNIYGADLDQFERIPVNPREVDMTPAILPSYGRAQVQYVDQNLQKYPMPSVDRFRESSYEPDFGLEYLGNTAVGVGASQFGGTAFAGGVSAVFSDILKENQLFTTVQVYGEIYDAGGQIAYINRGNSFNWGVGVSHIPYRYSRSYLRRDTLSQGSGENVSEIPVQNLVIETSRTFEQELTLFGQYPLSKFQRIEGGISGRRYAFRTDSVNNYYTYYNQKIAEDREKIDSRDPFYLMQGNLAFVGDNSTFGLTAPLNGSRYRFSIDRMLGQWDVTTILADYRKYEFTYPFSFAFRAVHYARYGKDAGDLYPFYVGNQYFVRGYTINDMREEQCIDGNCLDYNNLVGTRMAIANAEIRLPFTGPERLALIKSGFLFSDLVLFADGGLAWSSANNIEFSLQPKENRHTPIFSTGLGARINLFGYAIVEPYVAIPWQMEDRSPQFGLFLSAGGW